MSPLARLYRAFCQGMLTQLTLPENERQGWFDEQGGLCANLCSWGAAHGCTHPERAALLEYQRLLFAKMYTCAAFPFDQDFWEYLSSDRYTNPARLAHLRRFAA